MKREHSYEQQKEQKTQKNIINALKEEQKAKKSGKSGINTENRIRVYIPTSSRSGASRRSRYYYC